MTDFEITRDIVDTAANVGIAQIGGLHAPDEFGKLREDQWEYRCGGEFGFRGINLSDMLKDPNYNIFGQAIERVIDLARMDNYVNPNIRVLLKRSDVILRGNCKKNRESTDQKFADRHHIDDDTIEEGFSIFCAVNPKKDEVLHSAGRREEAFVGDFSQLQYAKGGILVAQKDFGKDITSGPLGQTWHLGQRVERGRLIIIDVSNQRLPRRLYVPS